MKPTFIDSFEEEPFPHLNRFITPWDTLINAEPPSFTVEGILPKAQATWLYGATGIGKSLIALDLALSVCYGTSAFSAYNTHRTSVLWLDYENGQQETIQRLKDMGHQPQDLQASNQFHIGIFPESINPSNAMALINDITNNHIGLLVIDSSGVGIEGDSNAADTYADFAKHLLNPLKKLGITILILDNIGKDAKRGPIGSSRKSHEAGATWQLTKHGGTWQLTAIKRRTLGLHEAIAIKQLTDPLRHVLTTYAVILDEQQQNIVIYLDGLTGAKMFPNRALHERIRDIGLGIKAERMDEAIRWWDSGNHSGIT